MAPIVPPVELEEVVISGISGAFPMCDNVNELREGLFNKENLVSQQNTRWPSKQKIDVPKQIGMIKKLGKFDSSYFGIHRKQTESLDPLTCQILERAVEAVMDAGLNPADLKGTHTGVFIASAHSESDNVYDFDVAGDGFGITGHNRSMLSTRISFVLDLKGPSYVTLLTWPAGLQVLRIAQDAVAQGRCSAAIVGAPNLALYPQMSWHMQQLGVLSPRGTTRPFDADADGYARSDGIVAMLIQRKRDAKRVYADVLYSDVCCYGQCEDYLMPEAKYITLHLKNFYDHCGVDPADIAYLEANGSGIKRNDEDEMQAVERVLLPHRKTPLLVGSIKSNMGHSENAASLCSLVKILIAMETGYIPPNINYSNPNPKIPALVDGRIKVVTEKTPWEGGLAAVTSIGIDGTVGHALVRSNPIKRDKQWDGVPRLVLVSSRTDEGVEKMLSEIESMPMNVEFVKLLHDIHSNNVHNHLFRGYTILNETEQKKREIEHYPGINRPIWFVFSGMGSQWPGMAKSLLQLPMFKEAIDKCHNILAKHGVDLYNIITGDDPKIFDNILNSFVGIAAIQIGLTDVLNALGIQPDGYIGHSVGELGCAYADGCLTAEQMILCAYYRGRASIEVELVKGMMAAVGLGYSQMKDMVPEGIEVACHNGPTSCTLSGPAALVEEFVATLKAKGVFARSVNVANIAYHSSYIKPAAPKLLSYLKSVITDPKPRSSKWICTSIPEERWGLDVAQTVSPEYLTNNLLSQVYFEEGSKHIPKNAICIEVAPHGLLQAILRQSLGSGVTNIGLAQRGNANGLEVLLSAVGKMYLLGLQPQIAELYPPVEFPVSRGTPAIAPLVQWEHSETWPLASFLEDNELLGEQKIDLDVNVEENKMYGTYNLDTHTILPAALLMKLVWENLAYGREVPMNALPVTFEDLIFHDVALTPKRGALKISILIQRGCGKFEVIAQDKLIFSGKVYSPEDVEKEFCPQLPDKPSQGTKLSKEDIYSELSHRGYKFGPEFQTVTSVTVGEQGCVATVEWSDHWVKYLDALVQLALLRAAEGTQDLRVPSFVRKLVINPQKHLETDNKTEAVYHHVINVVKAGEVEMVGLESTPLSSLLPLSTHLKLEQCRFLSNKNPMLKNMKDVVKYSAQLSLENYSVLSRTSEKPCIAVITDMQAPDPEMEDCLASIASLQVDVERYPPISKSSTVELKPNCVLAIMNTRVINNYSSVLGNSGALLLSIKDAKSEFQQEAGVVLLSKQQCGNTKLFLLRKEIAIDMASSPVVAIRSGEDWRAQLKTVLSKSRPLNQRVYLFSDCLSPRGVLAVKRYLKNEVATTSLRCIFILDNNAPAFSVKDNFYKMQLEQDLFMNVFKKGSWGSYQNLPIAQEQTTGEAIVSLNLQDIDVAYTGLNKWDPSTFTKEEQQKRSASEIKFGPCDFAGTTKSGQKLMGVATDQCKEPLISWPIPSGWSFEDAATVPYVYSMAYYGLKQLGQLVTDDVVLIHSGWSVLGRVAISLALDIGCGVFTTVQTEEERQALRKQFPKIKAEHIFSTENTEFEKKVLEATSGKGVKLCLNTLTEERMQASLRCMAVFGVFLQCARADLDHKHFVGMNVFMKSVSFYGVSPNMLEYMNPVWRKELEEVVAEGLKNGAVKPLERHVVEATRSPLAIKMLESPGFAKKVLLKKVASVQSVNTICDVDGKIKLHCNPSELFVVFGGDKTGVWLDVAEWLVHRGARRLAAVGPVEASLTVHQRRRLALLAAYHGADVSFHGLADGAAAVSALMHNVAEKGPVGGIFITPMNVAEDVTASIVKAVDASVRRLPLRFFVGLLCDAAVPVCDDRLTAGLPAFAVISVAYQDVAVDAPSLLNHMDVLFQEKVGTPIVAAVLQTEAGTKLMSGKMFMDKMHSMFPMSKDELIRLARRIQVGNATHEMLTLSPGLKHSRLVPPVFLVPGLRGEHADDLKAFALKIMYPMVALRLNKKHSSIEEYAAEFVQNVKEIQPKGPYAVVGELCGGPLAFELASQLEKGGDAVRLFLLDGAPDTVHAILHKLGEDDNSVESSLLTRLFGVKSEEISEELKSLADWQSRLDRLPTFVDFSCEIERRFVTDGLHWLREHVRLLRSYAPCYQLRGDVHLLLPDYMGEDDCGLLKLCTHTVCIHNFGTSYTTMASHGETAHVVNRESFD